MADETLKFKHMNTFHLRTVEDVNYFAQNSNDAGGVLYSLTTRFLKDDGSRPYEIEVKSYRMLQHGRKTTFGGSA